MNNSVQIVAAVLSHVRGELSAACIADMFGVSEKQVHAWKDVFQVAGVLALGNFLNPQGGFCVGNGGGGLGEPTTTPGHPPPSVSRTGRGK